MLDLLQGHVPLVVGALLALLLIGVRAASADTAYRNDLRGAILFLIGFLGVRTGAQLFDGHLPHGIARTIRVAWMLLFAFGVIRTVVSTALWMIRFRSRPTPKILRDVIDFVLYTVTALPIVRTELEIDVSGLLATSAFLSVLIGLAMQETLGNLFAGLSIQLERPFQVGDQVTIDEHTGRVVQVAWRATRLETGRREIITLPNNILSKQPVKNYSRGKLPVGVDVFVSAAYDAPPNRVKEILLEVVGDIPFVLPDPPPSARTVAYEDSAIKYRVRYFVAEYGQSDIVADEFHSRLWYRFRREGIDIPFPQREVRVTQGGEAKADIPAETLEQLLQTVDLFSILAPQDRARLAREMRVHRFGRGERIIEEGSHGETFYLVAAGEVTVKTGRGEVEVTRLKRGQYFGEMSLLTGEPRAATVVAVNDAVLLEVDRPVFARLFGEHPGLARQLSAILAQRRNQLRAAAEAVNGAPDAAPEAGRIFGRLRQIFGLAHD